MKIQNLKINNFGKLNKKEINFSNNINIIYGNNESGKSTLLKFIQAMFYGLSKNKNGKQIADFEKYTPWEGEQFSGKLKYKLDNGEQYEICREFRKKDPKIFNENLEDISEQFSIDKTKGNQFFYEQTKIDEELFLSTIVAEQEKLKLDEKSQTTLVQKLSNLASTGEENTSFQKIMNKLNKMQLEKIGTKRSQDRPVNIIENKLKELHIKSNTLEEYQDKEYEIEEEKREIQKQIKEKQLILETLQLIKEMQDKNQIEKEKINISQKQIEDCNYNIQTLIQELDKIEQSNKIEETQLEVEKKERKTIIISTIIIVIGIILSVISIILLNNIIVKFIPILFTIVYIIGNLYIMKKRKMCKTKTDKVQIEKRDNEIQAKKEKIEIQKQILEEKKKEQEQQIIIIEAKIRNNIEIEKQIIRNTIENQELQEELKQQIETTYIEDKIIYIQGIINDAKIKIHRLEIEAESILKELENILQIKEEIANLQEQYTQLQEYDESIEIAKQEIQKAYEEVKKNVTPQFTDNLSETIKQISNSKYEIVKFNDEKGIIVEVENGSYVNANMLSIGTIDQLYLSLRLSTIEGITQEKMPIILDEAFAYFDEIRLENVLKYLNEKFSNRQIIIFTCTNREKEILKKNEIQYTEIEI